MLGQRIDIDGRAATVRLTATPGRNIGVLASVGTDAIPVLAAAAGSLAGQYPPDEVSVVDRAARRRGGEAAERVAGGSPGRGGRPPVDAGWAPGAHRAARRRGRPRLQAGVVGDPVLVVLFAADAAETALDRAGTEALRTLLRSGPETGVHVLGWWRSIQRLRSVLTMGASVDDLGAWVALDVHGAELGPLVPGMQAGWAPRPGRGLFFDRAQHAQPEVIIVPSTEEWVTEEPAAARRYKDVLAELSAAAGELRERDRARAELIRDQLRGLEDDMMRAGERARLTAGVARVHWEAALDLLWDESWLRLSPGPGRIRPSIRPGSTSWTRSWSSTPRSCGTR